MVPRLRNPALMLFLMEVRADLDRPPDGPAAPFVASGFDGLEEVVAIRTAVLLGLLECHEGGRPRALTPEGTAWLDGAAGVPRARPPGPRPDAPMKGGP